jgi:hypothetical protein
MLFWTLQTTAASIVFIFLLHHLFLFFKTTLTVPKVKDLLRAPAHKYDNIYQAIRREGGPSSLTERFTAPNGISSKESMKSELKSFLKDKLKDENKRNGENDNQTTSITSLTAGGTSGGLMFSEY